MSGNLDGYKAEYLRTHRKIEWAERLLYVACVAFSIYWLATSSGPVLWFGQLQLKLFGVASVMASLFAGIACLVVPGFFILGKFLAPLRNRMADLALLIVAEGGLPPDLEPQPTPQRAQSDGRLLTRWGVALLIVGSGLFAAALLVFRDEGADSPKDAMTAPEQSIDLMAQGDRPPAGSRAAVHGIAIPAAAQQWEDSQKKAHYYAIPFVASSWPPQTPVRYFLQLRRDPKTPLRSDTYGTTAQGKLIANGLPPHVKTVFEAKRIRVMEPHYLLLPDGDDAENKSILPFALSFAGGILLTIIGMICLACGLRMKRFRG